MAELAATGAYHIGGSPLPSQDSQAVINDPPSASGSVTRSQDSWRDSHSYKSSSAGTSSRSGSMRDRGSRSGSPEHTDMDHPMHMLQRSSLKGSHPPIGTTSAKNHPHVTIRPPKLADLKISKDIHRVRSYSLTKKGLVNQGEHYISRSPSEMSMCSSTSVDTNMSIMPVEPYKVLLLGAMGVGKRALIHEFMDPDCQGIYFQSIDDDADRSVSILLDGQESTMEFVDMSDREVDEFVTADQIDAYVVVYSVEDRKSFETAIDRLYEIRQQEARHIALILVANKTDLVRTRVVLEEEGRSAAKTYDCKYIEVSAAIDHRIDELLVGILKQIRLIKERTTKHVTKKKKVPTATLR